MATTRLTDSGVQYALEGAGTGLVLVHGASMDATTNYAHLFQHFSEHHRVIAPDYAGSGGTPLPAGGLTLNLLARQVTDVIDAAADAPVDLVGFSLGAAVAATIAADQPELVRNLVLVAGFSHTADPRLRLGLETWIRVMDADQDLATATAPMMAFSPRFLSSLGDEGLAQLRAGKAAPGTREQVELSLHVDIREKLVRIIAPTLIVGCALDYLVPVEHSIKLHEAIPHSSYQQIESGHVVFHERPAEIVAAIRNFVA